jgi:Uma2 family endonuclease
MSAFAEPPLIIADLEAAPDDGNRYELIEGELHVSSSPSYFHQKILIHIIRAFLAYLDKNPVGEVTTNVGVIFDDYNGVIPDLVYFSHERGKRILKGDRFSGAPEIVIEILSPGSSNIRRDRHLKQKLYSSRGVDEYWIIDPETRTIDVHRKRKEGGLQFAVSLQENDELTTPVLPDFRVSVAALLKLR